MTSPTSDKDQTPTTPNAAAGKATAKASTASGEARPGGLPVRAWVGIAIAIFSLLFILVNWDQTNISFIFFRVQMPLTIALALTFIGGGVTGALLMRRRDRK